MAAATSTLHPPFGLGPRAAHGGQQMQGPPQSAPGPSAAPHTEEQRHKPFFYIQPSQPYMAMQSMQWPVPLPMPVSYNPYYGYPGIGYGMPMVPPYPPNPYIEAPGFVVPHSHLHLMDYRRMLNPQYYQSMAYHTRRLRYQQNAPSREMTSSEVQTEPLSATQRTNTPGPSSVVASGVCSSDTLNMSTSQSLSPGLAVQKEEQSLQLKDVVPSTTTRMPPNGSFVIQTEEVRIECCTTPVGLQVLHSHETAEVSHSFTEDVVQRSSVFHGHVLQDDNLSLPVDQSEQAPQVCPDILLVGTPCSGEKIPALEESSNQTDTAAGTSDLGSQVDVEESSKKYPTSKNFDFKVVRLPFDPKYLDELRRMESTVWSGGEDTLVPSPEFLMESHVEIPAVAEVLSTDTLVMRAEAASEHLVPVIEMLPLPEEELQDLVPTVEPPADDMVCEADICPVMDVPVAEEAPVTELKNTVEPPVYLIEDKGDGNQQRCDSNPDHPDTSFESLPTYLPSSSWLSDFDSVHYCSKMPPTPKKTKPLNNRGSHGPSRRRKLDLEYKEPTVRKPKERYKPKGKADRQSLSDYECCVSRNFNKNMFLPYGSKGRRLCTRCLGKQRVYTSTSTGQDGQALKRKASPFRQWNDLPTCDVCRAHSNRRLREGSSPEVHCSHRGHDTEGESSETGSCRSALKWRAAEDRRKFAVIKKPLASKQNLEQCPTATYRNLSEKNCVCNEPQHHPATWQRQHHCPHGNTIREMDENCAMAGSVRDKWRNTDHIYLAQRCQTEKSWKAVMPTHETESFKNEARAQYLNKHKNSQPQSQGTCRKDTRC